MAYPGYLLRNACLASTELSSWQRATRATLAPNKVGVNFTLHSYDYEPDAERIGLQAAQAIGVEPRRLLTSLMAAAGRSAQRGERSLHTREVAASIPPPPTVRIGLAN